MITITIGSATDLGRRENNEDSMLAVAAQDPTVIGEGDEPAGASALLIMADGMGGRAKGHLASATAVKMVYKELAHVLAMRADVDRAYLENCLHNAFRQANTRIRDLGAGDAEAGGMGTTCTVALITRGMIGLAHVGDTRASLVRPGQPIELLTEDHSVVAGEVRAGRLTEDEARRSKFRNVITRAVGVEESVSPDIQTFVIEPDERTQLVLSSDGLHGAVVSDRIEEIVRRAATPQEAAEALVAEAKANGASDNISVIVAKVEDHAAGSPNGASPASASRRRSGGRQAGERLPGNILAFVIGLAIAGASAYLFLPRPAGTGLAALPVLANTERARATSPPTDFAGASYGAPEPLLGRTVMGSVLIRAQDDFLVVDPSAHTVLKVRPETGAVLTSVPDAAHLAGTAPHETYWAADPVGDLYQSQTTPPSIRKYDAEGQFVRTIGQGVLTAPGALTVTSNGDIYVIDSGTLKRIRAVAPAHGVPASVTSTDPDKAP